MFNINEHMAQLPQATDYSSIICLSTIGVVLVLLRMMTHFLEKGRLILNCDSVSRSRPFYRAGYVCASLAVIVPCCAMVLGAMNIADREKTEGEARTVVASQLQEWAHDRYDVELSTEQALLVVDHPHEDYRFDIDGRAISYSVDQSSNVMLIDMSQLELPRKDA